MDDLARRIDALLPQTQCTQCGYDGCLPYAKAIARGQAAINQNQCPPGGQQGIEALAALMGCEPLPLNPAHGQEKPLEVAIIDESVCIGCTLCIQACPVDAILGAPKRMHSILPMHCTGCALCVAPCPMDCIRMEPLDPPRPWLRADADRARARMHARKARLQAQANEDNARLEAKALAKLDEIDERTDLSAPELAKKKAVVQAAIARARARRKQTPTHQP